MIKETLTGQGTGFGIQKLKKIALSGKDAFVTEQYETDKGDGSGRNLLSNYDFREKSMRVIIQNDYDRMCKWAVAYIAGKINAH